MNIPRIFHRIWFGPNPIPDIYDTYWEQWQRKHPKWEMRTWTYANLPALINQTSFDDCGVKWPALSHTHDTVKQHVMRADIASYDLIYQLGGVYLNCDMEPTQPITPLLHGVDAFAGWEIDRDWIGCAIFGATPHHPFFAAVIDAIPDRVERGWEMERATGPYLITNIFRHQRPQTLTPYPAAYLYDGEYATHHQGHQIAWH